MRDFLPHSLKSKTPYPAVYEKGAVTIHATAPFFIYAKSYQISTSSL